MLDLIIKILGYIFLLIGSLSAAKLDLYAKAIYWYTSETIDWAYTRSHTANTVQSTYQEFVFDWAPGFSVGLGYTMNHDGWDTQASYTWFQSHASDQAGGGVETITPGFLAARLSLLEPFSTGKANMNIHYNMFDWDVGCKLCLSPRFSVRPAVGVKGGWIDQTIHSHWTLSSLPGFAATENLKQTFQAGGAKGSVAGKWCFGNLEKHTFSLIGNFEAGYLWGYWSIHDKFTDTFSSQIYLKTTPRNYGCIVFHSLLGLGWDYCWSRTHLALQFGYEIEDWLNQCQFFTNISGSLNSDLILQGVNLSFKIDF